MANDSDDKYDFLDKETEYLREDEINNALNVVMASLRHYDKYEEAVCLKALLFSMKTRKVSTFKALCVNYLSTENPAIAKHLDKYITAQVSTPKETDVDFLKSLGIIEKEEAPTLVTAGGSKTKGA